jgi:aubergine-like protein
MKDTKMMYLMCNTKIKTKFVMKNGNRYDNPKVGTILDHSVVKKDLYDFFLVSTQSRQGVPTPAHYSVLIDEIKYPKGPEKI